jgi:hypothetical protein
VEVSSQLYDPAVLPPGKERRYPFDRRMGGPQSRSGRGGEEKSITTPARNRTPVVRQAAKSLYGLSSGVIGDIS